MQILPDTGEAASRRLQVINDVLRDDTVQHHVVVAYRARWAACRVYPRVVILSLATADAITLLNNYHHILLAAHGPE